MKNFTYYVATVVGALWLQILINHLVGGTWFSVDVLLIAVLFFGLTRGPFAAECLALSWGLLVDASSLGVMGVHTLLYTVFAYGAGMLSRQLDASKIWTQTLFTLSVSTIYLALYLLLLRVLAPASASMQWTMAILPISNAVLAPIVFLVVDRWAFWWGMQPLED